MKANTRAWLIVIGSVTAFLLHVVSVEAAKLRYIRIGEHETFTRLVFEFHGPVSFKDAVIKGKGRLSVVFLDTTTTLPKQIVCDTTNRVDTIRFFQQKSHLKANVTLPFPYFALKSFSLSKPERVVLDVQRLKSPPKDVVFEEAIEKKKPERVVSQPAQKKPTLRPESPPAKEAGEIVEEPVVISKKPAVKASGQDLVRLPQKIRKQAPVQQIEPVTETVKIPTQVAAAYDESVPPLSRFGLLQIYLLASLVILSVIIIALLVFVFFKKTRKPKLGQIGEKRDEMLKTKKTMAVIDAKIKKQFDDYDKS